MIERLKKASPGTKGALLGASGSAGIAGILFFFLPYIKDSGKLEAQVQALKQEQDEMKKELITRREADIQFKAIRDHQDLIDRKINW